MTTSNGTGLAFKTLAPSSYPAKIKLSDGAEQALTRMGEDLKLDRLQLHQLPPSLLALYVLAYEEGRASLQEALDRSEYTADRLYAEVCRRPPARQLEGIPFAELVRRRNEYETKEVQR